MNKSLLIGLTLSASLLLSACGTKEETPTSSLSEPEAPTSEVLLTNDEITMTCPEAVQSYLSAANLEGIGESTVQSNDAIVVDYIGRLADGTVFDTSIESVAKACGIYTEGRDYNEGLPFTAGAGQMIPGFDAAVIGMKVGQTKTVDVPVAEAYGEYNPQFVISFSTEGIDVSGFTEGVQIMTQDGPATITKLTDKEITLDYNSALAGKDLIFDVTIKSIN
ncbi:MAG: FKBP-type peptidyl-prolyl cis-trans isomerase [Candidatus Peribacteria bacterium]|jgi:FKBP-type peptidyl-prolyl cis-trans isomerase 2|nr:FKBP-type peptidyl-prolyl cis-trans isomerase [Candidatus Peribacteria bacterium]